MTSTLWEIVVVKSKEVFRLYLDHISCYYSSITRDNTLNTADFLKSAGLKEMSGKVLFGPVNFEII